MYDSLLLMQVGLERYTLKLKKKILFDKCIMLKSTIVIDKIAINSVTMVDIKQQLLLSIK
jgi:hypothetical protein